MQVEKLNMKNYLGQSIQVYKNNGDSFNYKPDGFIEGSAGDHNDHWLGYDDEMIHTVVYREEIMAVKVND